MAVVEFLEDGTLLFNWESLPDKVKDDTKLRDQIFSELKQKYPENSNLFFDNKMIFEMNEYVIRRIREETETSKSSTK
jgi:acyl-CoA thioesterase